MQAFVRTATLNGIRQRWFDSACTSAERARPVVLFLHGWPESMACWRHQLRTVADAGYRTVAPDMRGYGGTEAPEHFAAYNVYTLAADMLALLQHLGAERAALVGHDHGANLGWKLALLHPASCPAYCALSVPYAGRPAKPPSTMLRARFGDERAPPGEQKFNYQLHHQLPGAGAQYDADARRALLALLAPPKGHEAGPTGAAPVQSDRLWVDGVAEPFWRRLPQPAAPPPFMPADEFEALVASYVSAGFEGGLNWYRVMDLDWHATPQLEGAKLTQPVAFIGGKSDMVLRWFGGPDGVRAVLPQVCERPPEAHFLEGGHWIQQEAPARVSEILLGFLGRHRERLGAGKAARL